MPDAISGPGRQILYSPPLNTARILRVSEESGWAFVNAPAISPGDYAGGRAAGMPGPTWRAGGAVGTRTSIRVSPGRDETPQDPAHRHRPLAHRGEAEALAAGLCRVEPHAVVDDRERGLAAGVRQGDGDVGGAAVPQGVLERLLGDAEQGDLDLAGEPHRFQVRRVVEGHGGRGAAVLGQVLEGRHQPEGFQRGRIQAVADGADLADEGHRPVDGPGEGLGGLAAQGRLGAGQDVFEGELQADQFLADGVVEFAGQAQALPLAVGGQRPQGGGQGPLGPDPLRAPARWRASFVWARAAVRWATSSSRPSRYRASSSSARCRSRAYRMARTSSRRSVWPLTR